MRPDIMIIGDSEDQIQLMKTACLMVDPSMQIISASGGEQALTDLRSRLTELPKVVLLDLRMPGMDGQETLSILKADPNFKRLPVCIFSNADLENEICDCYERGANFYFRKPTGLKDLKIFLTHFNAIWFYFASHCPN